LNYSAILLGELSEVEQTNFGKHVGYVNARFSSSEIVQQVFYLSGNAKNRMKQKRTSNTIIWV